jgi:ABC-type Na+ transport system ATPase subunit NatA
MKIAERMQMLYNQSQAKKPFYGMMTLTPNEKFIAEAVDLELSTVRQQMAELKERVGMKREGEREYTP